MSRKLLHYSKIPSKTLTNSHHKPWVFLHGLLGSSTNYKRIGKESEISGKNDIYLVDLRNHGNSFHSDDTSIKEMASDVDFFIDEVGLGEVNVMGHSLGGKIGLELALKHPGKVNSLLMVDVGPYDYTLDM